MELCLTNIVIPGHHKMPWNNPYKVVRTERLLAMDCYTFNREQIELSISLMEKAGVYLPTATEWDGFGTLRLQWKDDDRSVVLYFHPQTDTVLFSAGRVGEFNENRPTGSLCILIPALAKWLTPPKPITPLTEEERKRGYPKPADDCARRPRFRNRGGPLPRQCE